MSSKFPGVVFSQFCEESHGRNPVFRYREKPSFLPESGEGKRAFCPEAIRLSGNPDNGDCSTIDDYLETLRFLDVRVSTAVPQEATSINTAGTVMELSPV